MDSLISVIIPTYNYAKYLPQAIESVLNQTLKNFEIIVVDDGSTDNTKDVLKPYRSSIRYIYQQNKGLPSAKNTGIKASHGEFIAFLDSDDLWLPEKLELQKRFYNEHPSVGMVICNGFLFDETGIIRTFFPVDSINPIPKDLHTSLFLQNIIPVLTTLTSKNCFDKIGLHDETLTSAEDLDLWIRLTRYFTVGYVPEPLVKYRKHPEAMSMNVERMCENKIRVIKKNLILFPDVLYKKPAVQNRLSDYYFELSLANLKKLRIILAIKHLLGSIKYRPLWLTPLVFLCHSKIWQNFKRFSEEVGKSLKLNKNV
jgi:glycosyltransferase involved in cell wall biosynthesis